MKQPDEEIFRFLKKLVSLEEEEENEQIRTEFIELSPQERELRGKALLNLELTEKHFSPADHILATFSRRDKKEFPLFSLEEGDLVSVFPEKIKVRDYPLGTVYEKTAGQITLAFKKSLPEWADEARVFQLHKSVNRVTYKRMLQALDAVLETRNTRLALLRDISLRKKKPTFSPGPLKGLRWLDRGLNASQKEAVKKALCAEDLMLVHGPPGTGKTTALVEIIRQSILRRQSVFVTAPSNTACDNLLERLVEKKINAVRLGHPARITQKLRDHTLDFKLALHPIAGSIQGKQTELERLFKRQYRYREKRSPGRDAERELRQMISTLKDEIRQLRSQIFHRVMGDAQTFIGTPTSIQDRVLRGVEFDVLVFDEATQATEPVTWIPVTRAKKVIMAGDHFQLPPTVRSKEAEKQGLGITLFERFYDILDENSKQLLERQYRMHRQIMGFSSKEFYKGLLVADPSVENQILADLKKVKKCEATTEALIFIDTAGKGFEEHLEEGSESRFNPEEAELVLSELRKMLELGVRPEAIAVISPYSAQVRLLTSRSPDPQIEIDSVDGFQGREKELVIVSLVRSNVEGEMGFLTDTRRMNVAMTRARRKLIVIGDSATLSSIAFYRDFMRYAEDQNAYRSAWELSEL